jgi:hypothetical protein
VVRLPVTLRKVGASEDCSADPVKQSAQLVQSNVANPSSIKAELKRGDVGAVTSKV